MFSAEVLSQLRSLNWLAQEIRRVPDGSAEEAYLRSQIEAVRARLPHSILAHHDQFAAHGQHSAVQVSAGGCGACRTPLSADLLAELALPGHFGVCPHCGSFLWSADDASLSAPPDSRSGISAEAPARAPFSSVAVAPNTPRLET